MSLQALIKESLCFAKIECTSKKRILDTIAHKLADQNKALDEDKLFMQLMSREQLGSTGIGQGVAIPHCRFDTQGETMITCLSLSTPIDFDAIDQQPVDLIFAMIVPNDADDHHLQNLASLAEALQNPTFTQSLRAADNTKALFNAAINSQARAVPEQDFGT